ncbi:MAG: hypothetical protein GYB65_20065 [Chloroflexi bacterium]|nr:hypothetical protein [Chloroflexota bacterium]
MHEVEGLIYIPDSPFNNPLTGIQALSNHTDCALAFQRGACCLNYKRPDGKYCASCPITRPSGVGTIYARVGSRAAIFIS